MSHIKNYIKDDQVGGYVFVIGLYRIDHLFWRKETIDIKSKYWMKDSKLLQSYNIVFHSHSNRRCAAHNNNGSLLCGLNQLESVKTWGKKSISNGNIWFKRESSIYSSVKINNEKTSILSKSKHFFKYKSITSKMLLSGSSLKLKGW